MPRPFQRIKKSNASTLKVRRVLCTGLEGGRLRASGDDASPRRGNYCRLRSVRMKVAVGSIVCPET